MTCARTTAPLESASGVFGTFVVLLGAGFVLDADWLWRGGGLMALGASFLSLARARSTGEAP